jgi:hypothetical protein
MRLWGFITSLESQFTKSVLQKGKNERDLGTFSSGIYFARIRINEITQIIKLIKAE